MRKQKTSKDRSQRHSELKKQSFEQPGIKDLMIVYDHWKESHKAEQAHQEIKKLNYTTVNSDTSNPKSFFRKDKILNANLE